MGTNSGPAYVFVRRYNVTYEEVQKLTPADGETGDWFGYSVVISGDTAVIGTIYGEGERGIHSGSGYVYTNISRKWIENGKIVPEDGGFNDLFGSIVSFRGV